MLKKSRTVTGLITGMMLLYLCGCNQLMKPESDVALTDETVISIDKDGGITTTMVEKFEASYYQQAELQDMILSEAAAYNAGNGEGSIGVEKIQVENGLVNVIMNFADMECYADYKEVVFFVGTIAEAQEKGFDLNITCHEVDDESKTVSKDQIVEMEKVYILITDEPVGVPSVLAEETIYQPISVETFGKVLYVSDGVVQGRNKNSVRIEAETEGLSYIIFK